LLEPSYQISLRRIPLQLITGDRIMVQWQDYEETDERFENILRATTVPLTAGAIHGDVWGAVREIAARVNDPLLQLPGFVEPGPNNSWTPRPFALHLAKPEFHSWCFSCRTATGPPTSGSGVLLQ